VSELVRGELLDCSYAFFIQKLHVVSSRAIQEIVSAYSQPEEMEFGVGVRRVVIHLGDVRGSERTVGTQIGELVEMTQSVGQSLVAPSGESSDGSVVTVVDGAIVALDVRHQVIDEVVAEHIVAEAHLGHLSVFRRWEQLIWISVWQDDDHVLGGSLGQQVVDDVVHPSHFVIYLLGVGCAADEIENGVFLLDVGGV